MSVSQPIALKNLRKASRPPVIEDESTGSRSLRRALDILDLMLQRGGPLTVAQIIEALSIPKSTAYELVRTLTEANCIEPSGKGSGLYLGRKLYEFGMAYHGHVDLLRDGSIVAEELRNETGETVQLSVLENDQMMVLLKEEGVRPLRIISNVGSRVPINWAAAGRLLVSDLDDKTLTRLLTATVRQSPSGKATMDVKKIIAQVRRYRRQGYATELNEANEHAGCIAAPIIDAAGRCIAALSVVVPEQRLARPNREHLIVSVIKAAEKLSRRIGGPRAV
ncbi:MAG: IclR family transcriptional regulator [Alphaproteobacteria bacterium]|nr:IclR family transcriptional regulator [Alphaproteobacteria bacterium]